MHYRRSSLGEARMLKLGIVILYLLDYKDMCLERGILAKKSPELFIIQLEYIFIGQTSTVLEPLQSMNQLCPQPPNEREFPPFQQMVCKFTSPTHQYRR